MELAGDNRTRLWRISFHLIWKTSRTAHFLLSIVVLLQMSSVIIFSYAVESSNQSQMTSRTMSLFHLLHRRQQGRVGHCLFILLGRRRVALEGRRSFTRNLGRRRSFRAKAVRGRSLSLSSWKSAWRSCTNMARTVCCMKEGRSRRARNGSSGAICV